VALLREWGKPVHQDMPSPLVDAGSAVSSIQSNQIE
jgi:hypothetical protein